MLPRTRFAQQRTSAWFRRKKEPIAMTTTTTSTDDLANIPHPPGATRVHEWFNDDQPRAP